MSSPHHELLTFGRVLPATFFSGHGLFTSVTYSSPSVQMHTYTILFYSTEGDHPGPSTPQG